MWNLSEARLDRPRQKDVTTLLLEWRNGNHAALDELMPLVYNGLRQLAARQLNRERPAHTLQSTAWSMKSTCS